MRWYRLDGGKIVETWPMFGLLQQIPAIPTVGQAADKAKRVLA